MLGQGTPSLQSVDTTGVPELGRDGRRAIGETNTRNGIIIRH